MHLATRMKFGWKLNMNERENTHKSYCNNETYDKPKTTNEFIGVSHSGPKTKKICS